MSDYIAPNSRLQSPPKQDAGLEPTYTGFVMNTRDALLIIQAIETGILEAIPRRPHDQERERLIRSGNIFVYTEQGSAIKRWTDGYNWSPSRILGNFLIYREMAEPFSPGEKKRARRKRSRGSSAGATSFQDEVTPPPAVVHTQDSTPECDRHLVGSLWDSYGFKIGGLVKKTISIALEGRHYHLVAYYSLEQCKGLTGPPLLLPSNDQQLNHLRLDPSFLRVKLREQVDADGNETKIDHRSTSPEVAQRNTNTANFPQMHEPAHQIENNFEGLADLFNEPAQYAPPIAPYQQYHGNPGSSNVNYEAGPSVASSAHYAAGPSNTSSAHYAAGPSNASSAHYAAAPLTASNASYDAGPSNASSFHFSAGPSTTSNSTYAAGQSSASGFHFTAGPSTSSNASYETGPSAASSTHYAAGPPTASSSHYAAGAPTASNAHYVAGSLTSSNESYEAPRSLPVIDLLDTTSNSNFYQHQSQQPSHAFGQHHHSITPTASWRPTGHQGNNSYPYPPFVQLPGPPAWDPSSPQSSNQGNSSPQTLKRKRGQH